MVQDRQSKKGKTDKNEPCSEVRHSELVKLQWLLIFNIEIQIIHEVWYQTL